MPNRRNTTNGPPRDNNGPRENNMQPNRGQDRPEGDNGP